MLMSWVDNIFTSQGNDRMIGKFISSKTSENVCVLLLEKKVNRYCKDHDCQNIDLDPTQGQNYPWTGGAMAPPKFFLKIYYYICVLILTILFYKITFYFPLTISLLFLRVMLYLQTFL